MCHGYGTIARLRVALSRAGRQHPAVIGLFPKTTKKTAVIT
jgi:hypothetical protein